MFRLIAIGLVATFALLGLAGTDEPIEYRQAGLISLGAAARMAGEEAQLRSGQSFVVQTSAELKAAAKNESPSLSRLRKGTSVLLLSGVKNGHVRVRDHAGHVGYVAVAALTPAP